MFGSYASIRYSSPYTPKDDAAVTALESWLHANGFTDTFVDHHGIVGGDKWREELRASAGACRLASP